jgi:hypothetical protein
MRSRRRRSVIKEIDIDTKKILPPRKNETIKMSRWIYRQYHNYKNKTSTMENIEVYNVWTEFINDPMYKKYFNQNDL